MCTGIQWLKSQTFPIDLSDLWQKTVISHLINGFSIIINRHVLAYIITTSEGKTKPKTKQALKLQNWGWVNDFKVFVLLLLFLLLFFFFSLPLFRINPTFCRRTSKVSSICYLLWDRPCIILQHIEDMFRWNELYSYGISLILAHRNMFESNTAMGKPQMFISVSIKERDSKKCWTRFGRWLEMPECTKWAWRHGIVWNFGDFLVYLFWHQRKADLDPCMCKPTEIYPWVQGACG